MILSDQSIRAMLREGSLVIRPMEPEQVQPASVDIRLGDTFSVVEDSSAGVVSIKLAGFSCIGVSGGNIDQAGVGELCDYRVDGLMEILDIIL